MSLLLAGSRGQTTGPNEPAGSLDTSKAALIECAGLIDDGLYESIKRRSELATEQGFDYLIYEIDTYGGLLKSAIEISDYLIFDVGRRAHTVAYVKSKAISAGAMISVSCRDIIMRENTTIGDCAPIAMGGKLEGVEREKTESFTRAAFVRAAEENGYPTALLKAMVTMQIEVYRVENLQSGQFEYFEGDMLPNDPNVYDLDGKQLLIRDDELLTWTAAQARQYDIAATVVDDIGGVLDFLAERDGVNFAAGATRFETNWSEEMVRWLNSPSVMSVLVMLAMLGVYIEFSTPGLGFPGLIAAVCFAVLVGSRYLTGMANWWEVVIFALGMVLLLIEFFLIPGFGVAGVLGIVCLLAGIFGMLIRNPPDQIPWPQSDFDWELLTNGLLGLVGGFIGFAVLAWAFTRYMPRTKLFSGLALAPTMPETPTQAVSMSRPVGQRAEDYLKIRDRGEVLSALRPSGKAVFGDAVVDVIAQGDFIKKGTQVEIIEIQGNRVVVWPVED